MLLHLTLQVLEDRHVVIPICDPCMIVRTRSGIICAMAAENLKPVYIIVLSILL